MLQIKLSELKRMSASEIREGPCVEIVADGEPIGILIVGTIGEMRDQITARAGMINASRGLN